MASANHALSRKGAIMLYNIRDIQGFTIRATDGDLGSVRTFYFDDASWVVRYLVVDTGYWLPGRRVLIAPECIGAADPSQEVLSVNLTQEEVKHSPDIDTDKPVSKQQEMRLRQHYNWPSYWTMRDPLVAQSLTAYPGGAAAIPPAAIEMVDVEPGDPYLRSMREVIGYHIQASDGQIGHVEDFIIDTDTWNVRYMVVDTRNWLPGKNVLVALDWIREVNWTDSQVHIELPRDHIKDSPEFDASEPVNRDYELKLYDYYGRPAYWS
jgi:sporulation protein YlmC with PRC-barrel domain